MTDNKAIEVANKIQLSSNPLWVEIKCFACDYEKQIKELEAQIEKMSELINRYYEVCAQIPKELRTMVFDSCLEDTQKMVKDREIK